MISWHICAFVGHNIGVLFDVQPSVISLDLTVLSQRFADPNWKSSKINSSFDSVWIDGYFSINEQNTNAINLVSAAVLTRPRYLIKCYSKTNERKEHYAFAFTADYAFPILDSILIMVYWNTVEAFIQITSHAVSMHKNGINLNGIWKISGLKI